MLGSVMGAAVIATDGPDARTISAMRKGLFAERGAVPTGGVEAVIAAASYDIPVVSNAPVQKFVKMFTTGSQSDAMALYLKRSGRYEAMIRGKLRDRGMPEDLLYLSMIESGFNTNARSHARAVGLWQFMAPTARDYGLRVDSYVDERRDPERSTDAALRYLGDLHEQFGAWYLAAAAYNTGQNRVERVMKQTTGATRGNDADFWRIRHRLPRETREYVPLMVAAALVAKEPRKHGLENVERWMPLRVDSVSVPAGVEFETVAAAIGSSESELARLNPHLIRKMTPPGNKTFSVRVPRGRGERFAARFEEVKKEADARAAVRAAEVRLAAVKRAETRRAEAKRAEVRRAGSRRLAVRNRATTRRPAAARARTHTVRNGENLWTIARRNDMTVAQIRRANGMRSSSLRPGQKLTIPRSGR
ncbi:MAG TPA: transglycosylase SLT domain-containing protein [Longimicrobium sp.]|nr:transglycosylase SLT domain-containing protein [Longimicrobium sp.]